MRLRFRNILTIKYCNMKKVLFIALSAGVALAACTKNEVKPVNVDQEITFQAVVNKASTKAMLTGTSYPTDSTFGTVAYKVKKSASELYIPVSEVKYYTGSPAYWSTEAPYYWPKDGSTLTFYSYSPFKYSETSSSNAISVTHTKDGLKFTDYSVKNHQKTDLMVADKQAGQTGNTSAAGGSWAQGVPTVFHHMLAQIVAIKFQTVENASAKPVVVKDYANHHDGNPGNEYKAGDKQFVVTDVFFENFSEQGTLTAEDSWSWSSTGSVTKSYTWYSETDGTKFIGGQCTPRDTYYLVLPQDFNDDNAKLHVKYEIHTYTSAGAHATEKMDVSVPLKKLNAKWEMNKKYTYTLNIDLDRIYWDPKVTEWESESTGSAEI